MLLCGTKGESLDDQEGKFSKLRQTFGIIWEWSLVNLLDGLQNTMGDGMSKMFAAGSGPPWFMAGPTKWQRQCRSCRNLVDHGVPGAVVNCKKPFSGHLLTRLTFHIPTFMPHLSSSNATEQLSSTTFSMYRKGQDKLY